MTDTTRLLSRAAEQMTESAIRKMGSVLASGRDVISFAPGYPAPETFPWDDFSHIAAELLASRDGQVLQYGPTRGYRPLLETIAGIMRQREVPVAIEDLLVTTGSQQGLDLVARVLIDPGDVILVELPTYVGALSAFRNLQASMVGVPQQADGIDLDALDATWERVVRREGRRVKFLYVVPNFQNPTGLLIGLEKRRRLLEWAERRDVLIVEDDPYRELYFEDSASEAEVRPIKADDTNGRVVYLSSFSKTLAPGFRVAWIAAPPALATRLEMAKQAEDLLTGSLDQRMIYEACRRGVLERQLPILRRHYAAKRDVMEAALQRELHGATWPKPKGGFFLWVALPHGIDAGRMIPRAIEHGVIYVSGDAFYVNGQGQNMVRLSFSAPTPERIDAGVARLAATLRAEMAARETAAATGVPGAS